MASERLGRFPIGIEIPVFWGDMDANRHVNNAVYARWFESARIVYFSMCPALMEAFEAQRFAPTLRQQEITYERSIAYPDKVKVGVSVTGLGNSSFTMGCTIDSEALGTRAATAIATMVMIDSVAGAATAIPEAIRKDFFDLEANAKTKPATS